MYSWEDPPRYQAGAATRAAGTVWYAASIVHDACHSRQYQRAWAAAGSQPDPTVLYGRESEAECLAVQHDALVKLNASPEEIKTVDTALETAYWDVPYADRWW
ncbi:hypothetical protein HY523_01365 [Candidatus Berkelbacteria bacterium]|nr:hypothetical protein [Candidatus Berkelbacteria bacterium]